MHVSHDNPQPGPTTPDNPIERRFEKVPSPFQNFIQDQTTSSILLVGCAVIALVIANSSLAHEYEALLQRMLGEVLGNRHYAMSVHHWINDALITLFFFLAGTGFNTSIFYTNPGFAEAPESLAVVKDITLIASLIAGVSGYLWLRFIP